MMKKYLDTTALTYAIISDIQEIISDDSDFDSIEEIKRINLEDAE